MLFLRSSPVGAKDPTESVAPTVLTLERAEIPGLAPGATYCRRSAASIGCASRVILDSNEEELRSPAFGRQCHVMTCYVNFRRGGVNQDANRRGARPRPITSRTTAQVNRQALDDLAQESSFESTGRAQKEAELRH